MSRKRLTHQQLYTCLGEAIIKKRKSLGMSQEELAKESGVDRGFISNVERGTRNPSLGLVASIALALKVRVSTLMRDAEDGADMNGDCNSSPLS